MAWVALSGEFNFRLHFITIVLSHGVFVMTPQLPAVGMIALAFSVDLIVLSYYKHCIGIDCQTYFVLDFWNNIAGL